MSSLLTWRRTSSTRGQRLEWDEKEWGEGDPSFLLPCVCQGGAGAARRWGSCWKNQWSGKTTQDGPTGSEEHHSFHLELGLGPRCVSCFPSKVSSCWSRPPQVSPLFIAVSPEHSVHPINICWREEEGRQVVPDSSHRKALTYLLSVLSINQPIGLHPQDQEVFVR